jgi:uncharacterized protein DUF3570
LQLSGGNRVRAALAAATGMLLGGSKAGAADWKFDSQVLYYSESDRVTAIEPVVTARWDRGEGKALNLKLTVDSLTGASASGAAPSSQPQTYTTPSGHGSYEISPGDTPLDPSFLDTRWALGMSWEMPLSPLWRATFGANASTEYDYDSFSVNAALARDFNRRNTTVSLGVSAGRDEIGPVGGVPRPLAPMSPEVPDDQGPLNRIAASDSKSVYDLLLGFTQVLDRRSLVQINYSLGKSDGYLTDPYKLVSVLDGAEPVDHLYEFRPAGRTKQSLYVAYKREVRGADVVDMSYRYLWDDWQVRSHTVELRYRWDLGRSGYLQPHARYYTQTAADFYTRFLTAGVPLPAHASADYRLGELDDWTLGVKYGRVLRGDSEWNVKLEYLRQSGRSNSPPGAPTAFDYFPSVDALMVQVGCGF